MPRVVPSQVVSLIDQFFPDAVHRQNFNVTMSDALSLSAVLRLAYEIPSELLNISGDNYTDYVSGLAAIDYTLKRWQNLQSGMGFLQPFKTGNPVFLIRHTLALCPDSVPSPTTAEVTFIADPELRDNIRNDISAADHDLHKGEWKSATVMAGSALEAILLYAVGQRSSDIPGAVDAARSAGRLEQKPSSDPEDWTLPVYIEIALGLKLITANTATQARLAKNFRNLVHPGRAARLGQICNRGTALGALAALELTVSDLTNSLAT